MGKVLFPIGDAAEAMDTLYPYFRVREEGYEAVIAGPEARVYPLVMHEIPPGWDITRESASYHLKADVAFRDVNPEEYTGYLLPAEERPNTCGMTPTCLGPSNTSSMRRNRLPSSVMVLKSWPPRT